MVLNVDGINLTPIQSGYDPDRTIIRPEYGGAGLLNDGSGAEYDNLINNFAGGLLNGYQVINNQVVPINPSGVFMGSGDPNDPNMGGDEGGDGAFTITDLMDFQSALNQGNFGNQDPVSVFGSFIDKGKGTYDIASNSGTGPITNLFYGTTAGGDYVPMSMAEYKLGGRKGEVIDPQLQRETIKGRLRLFDESGGDGGEGGADGSGGNG